MAIREHSRRTRARHAPAEPLANRLDAIDDLQRRLGLWRAEEERRALALIAAAEQKDDIIRLTARHLGAASARIMLEARLAEATAGIVPQAWMLHAAEAVQ